MKVTKENIDSIIPKKNRLLMLALLNDLDEINGYSNKKIYVDWQDFHDEYSCERTDPCPDYYGFYTIRVEGREWDSIGLPMSIEGLDDALCAIYGYAEIINRKEEDEDVSTFD